MGRVFLVRHRATGARRALKVLEGAFDAEMIARFQREAEALARLEGKGVVPIHEMSTEHGRFGLVMDWMSGGSLSEHLAARGRLPWEEAAALVAKLARTLERCAALGLVHRDVKPANVLLDERGEPRLADFGCVRDLGASALTETGTALGTPFYMAPEQWNGEKVDARADVFSLGVVLYELVTGALPHVGANSFAIQRAALRGERRRARDLVSLPPALEAAIEKALAPAPGGRHAGPGDLARELEALLSGKAGSWAGLAGAKRAALLAAPLGLLLVLGLVIARKDGRAPDRAPPSPAPPPRAVDDAERARAHAARVLALQEIAEARRCFERQNDDEAANALSKIHDLSAITSEEATSLAGALGREIDAIANRLVITDGASQALASRQAYRLLELAVHFDAGAVESLSLTGQGLVVHGFGRPENADWDATVRIAEQLLRLAPSNAECPVAHWLAGVTAPPDPARARALAERIHAQRADPPIVLVTLARAVWLWPEKDRDAARARELYDRALRANERATDPERLNSPEVFFAKCRLAEILEAEGRYEEASKALPDKWDQLFLEEWALNQRVRVLLRIGDLEAARKAANQGRRLGDPADKAFYVELARKIAAKAEPPGALVESLLAHAVSRAR